MWACDNGIYGDYLAHYGVVGMRWGIRRYQPYSYTGARKDGKLGKEVGAAARLAKRAAKAAGRGAIKAGKVAGKGTIVAGKAVGKGVVKAGKAAGKAAKEGYQKHKTKKIEEKKQRIIDFGTPKEIMNARGRLNEKEIEAAINRLNNDIRLRDINEKEMKRSIERGQKVIKNIVDMGTTLLGAYEMAETFKKKFDEHDRQQRLKNSFDPDLTKMTDKAIKNKDYSTAVNYATQNKDWDTVVKYAPYATDDQLKRAWTVKNYQDNLLGQGGNNKKKK